MIGRWLLASVMCVSVPHVWANDGDDELDALFAEPSAGVSDDLATDAAASQDGGSAADPAASSVEDESPPGNPAGHAELPDSAGVVTLPEAPPPPISKERPSRQIEEIIVTATKREESLREVAASVAALTGAQMEKTGIKDIDDIVNAVPGVNLSNQAGQNAESQRITIRGIAAGIGQNDTAGIFIDETPFTDVFFPLVSADASPYDMASVEIIKGPVGTLFGGSALNGAVRYVPNKPDFDEFELRGFAELSSNQESADLSRVFGGVLNVPVGENGGLRMVAMQRRRAGVYDSINQTYPGRDLDSGGQDSYRLIAAIKPLDALEASLMYLDQKTWADDNGYAIDGNGGRYERSQGALPSPSLSQYQTWQLKANWALSFADVVFVASDSNKVFDAFSDVGHNTTGDPNPAASELAAVIGSLSRPRSQELRLVSSSQGSWDYLIGLYNYNFRTDARINAVAGASFVDEVPIDLGTLGSLGVANATSEGIAVLNQSLRAEVGERAVFGEVNWRPLTAWQFTLGVRAYRFAYDGEVVSRGAGCVLSDPTCPINGAETRSELDTVERGLSPKFSAKWELSDDFMSYATVARGFRFGGVNYNKHPEIPSSYKSDTLWSYEIGIRSQWLERSLTTDVSVFKIDWRDAPTQQFTTDTLLEYTDNVGRVDGRGVEFQLSWLPPIDGVSLGVSGAYARIVTAEDFTSNSGTTTPKGTSWPRSPRWQTTANVGWAGELAKFGFGVTLNHSYFGEAIQGFSAVDNGKVYNYSEYAMNLNLSRADWAWFPEISLNIKNLTGQQAVTFRRDVNPPQSVRRYNNPREISLRVAYEF